jgi:hypothetical protein
MSDRTKRHIAVTLRMSQFELPPVNSALVVGRRSPIGSNALENALEEILPGAFVRVEVQHPVIEAVLVRRSITRRIDQDKLVELFVRHAQDTMEDTEALRVTCELVVSSVEEFEL